MKENFLFFLLPSIVTGVFGFFLLVPLTTYYLDPADFGIFALLTALTLPIGPLSSTGVSWVLAGNYFKIEEDQRRILLFNVALTDLALKSFWVVLFWLTTPWILPLFLREVGPQYILWFRLSLITILLTGFWPTVSYHLVLSKAGSRHALFEILPWATGAGFSLIALAHWGWKTETLFWSPIAAGAVLFVLNLWHLAGQITMKIDRKWLREVLVVGLPSIPAGLIEMLRNTLDRIFLERWLSLSALGVYSHSLSYRNLFTVGTKAFSRVFSPWALEIFSKKQNSEALSKRLNQWYALVGLLGIPIVFFADEAIAILTHGKFVAAAVPVKIWFFLILCFSYAIPYNSFLQAAKKTGVLMATDVVSNLIFLALTIPAIYFGGLLGAAMVYIAGNFALQMIRHWYSLKNGCQPFSQTALWTSTIFLLLGILISNGFQASLMAKIIWAVVFTACTLQINGITISELRHTLGKSKP